MKCPKCSHGIEHDFGMVTCPSCGSILFVDLEGKIHLNSDQYQSSSGNTNPVISSGTNPGVPSRAKPLAQAFQGNTNVDTKVKSSNIFQQALNSQVTKQKQNDINPFEAAAAEKASAQPLFSNSVLNNPQISNAQKTSTTPQHSNHPQPISKNPKSTGNEELNNFTNSPPEKRESFKKMLESMLQEKSDFGIVTYDIWIQNINNKDQRELLIECLTDTKFNWSVPEMLKNFKNGVLFITHCPPVKAGILIKRLLEYNLEVKWRQRGS